MKAIQNARYQHERTIKLWLHYVLSCVIDLYWCYSCYREIVICHLFDTIYICALIMNNKYVNHLPLLSTRSGDFNVPTIVFSISCWLVSMRTSLKCLYTFSLLSFFFNIRRRQSAWLPCVSSVRTSVHSFCDKISLFKSNWLKLCCPQWILDSFKT